MPLNRLGWPRGSSYRGRVRKAESVAAECVSAGGGRRRVGPTSGSHASAAVAGERGVGVLRHWAVACWAA